MSIRRRSLKSVYFCSFLLCLLYRQSIQITWVQTQDRCCIHTLRTFSEFLEAFIRTHLSNKTNLNQIKWTIYISFLRALNVMMSEWIFSIGWHEFLWQSLLGMPLTLNSLTHGLTFEWSLFRSIAEVRY